MDRTQAKQEIVNVLYHLEDMITSYRGYGFDSSVELPSYDIYCPTLEHVADSILHEIEEFISG